MACVDATLSLNCNPDTSIHILSAAYGLLNENPAANATCQIMDVPTPLPPPCYAAGGFTAVQEKCEGKESCAILVQTYLSGTMSTCPPLESYLKVTYGCATRK